MATPGVHDIARRDIHFDLSAVDLNHWHPAGPQVSHYFNVQSLLFPPGERFFIRSVRHYRDQITDPRLQQQVTGFIGQEATHSREHETYNAKLAEVGYKVRKRERFLRRSFAVMERMTSPETRLAMTVAFEHLTALAAEDMLGDEQVLEGADPEMARLWRWHSLEEAEHKAVAFDVYQQVVGTGFRAWLKRSIALLMVTFGMQLSLWVGLLWVMTRSGQLFQLSGWGRLFKLLWLKPGLYRRALRHYFQFFKPGFHPWDVDNYDQIQRWASVYQDRRP